MRSEDRTGLDLGASSVRFLSVGEFVMGLVKILGIPVTVKNGYEKYTHLVFDKIQIISRI